MESVKQGYKRTEVGVIPEDWEVAILKDCLINQPEYGINAASIPYTGESPKYLRITDITAEGHFKPDPLRAVNHPSSGNYFLQNGDIVLARTGASVGKSYLYDPEDGELVFAGFLIRVRPNSKILIPEYLANWIRTDEYWNWVSKMSVRSGQPGINGTEYSQLQIPLPPTIQEQRAIAEALTDMDDHLAALDALIAKKRAIKQATMQRLLTGDQRLPGFDGEWTEYTIDDLFTLLKTASNPRSHLRTTGKIQYIHYGDIHQKFSTYLDCHSASLPFIDPAKVSTVPNLQIGDLVMADASEDYEGVGASIEITSIGKYPVVAGLHTLLLRSTSDKLANGFKGYLQYIPNYHRQLREIATGISVYGISKRNIRGVRIKIPKTEEQRAITEVLKAMDTEITALKAERGKIATLKQGMMQELLTGKTRLI